MYEAKQPSFWKYVDGEGKIKSNAPESAKTAYKKWKSEPTMVTPNKKTVKGSKKKK